MSANGAASRSTSRRTASRSRASRPRSKAQVLFGGQQRDLTLSAREDAPGWYESVFIPTAAGKYTFHLTGTIEGQTIDESFTSSPTGFDEVNEAATGQFPNILPTTTEVSADAKKGADAAGQLPAGHRPRGGRRRARPGCARGEPGRSATGGLSDR